MSSSIMHCATAEADALCCADADTVHGPGALRATRGGGGPDAVPQPRSRRPVVSTRSSTTPQCSRVSRWQRDSRRLRPPVVRQRTRADDADAAARRPSERRDAVGCAVNLLDQRITQPDAMAVPYLVSKR